MSPASTSLAPKIMYSRPGSTVFTWNHRKKELLISIHPNQSGSSCVVIDDFSSSTGEWIGSLLSKSWLFKSLQQLLYLNTWPTRLHGWISREPPQVQTRKEISKFSPPLIEFYWMSDLNNYLPQTSIPKSSRFNNEKRVFTYLDHRSQCHRRTVGQSRIIHQQSLESSKINCLNK
jgi:hypothetical protein